MAKSKVRKEEELQALLQKSAQSKSLVFLQYLGLTVSEAEELRRKLRDEKNEMVVAKKSLLGLMLSKRGVDNARDIVRSMEGGVAVAFGYADEVAPARVIADFAKTHEPVKFFGGVFEGRYCSKEEMTTIAALPTRQELLTSLVGSFRAPLTGFARTLRAPMQAFVAVLRQRS